MTPEKTLGQFAVIGLRAIWALTKAVIEVVRIVVGIAIEAVGACWDPIDLVIDLVRYVCEGN